MKVLHGGCELILIVATCSIIEILICLNVVFLVPAKINVLNILICVLILQTMVVQEIARVILLSKQVKWSKKIQILLFW